MELRKLPAGAEVHPENSLMLYRSAVVARRLTRPELAKLPKEVQEIALSLKEEHIKLLADYETVLKSSSNPRARQLALEQLHRTFWEVIPAERVREIGKFSNVERLTTDTIAKLAEGKYEDATTRLAVKEVQEQMRVTEVARRAERELVDSRTKLLDAASETGSPGVVRDMVSFVHQDGMLGRDAGRLLSPMTTMLREANATLAEPTVAKNPANKAFVERAIRKLSDYAMIHEDAAGLEQAALVFSGVLKGARTSGNLAGVEGMMRLIEAPVEAARTELLGLAKKAGVLEQLKKRTREEMEAEGKRPTEEEVLREISLRELRTALEEKLLEKHQGKPEQLERELAKLDKTIQEKHDQGVAESLMKLLVTSDGKINPDRLSILAKLFAKPKRGRPCLNPRLVKALAAAAAAVVVIAPTNSAKAAEAKQVQAAINNTLLPCAEGDEKKCPAIKEMDQPTGRPTNSDMDPGNINLKSH